MENPEDLKKYIFYDCLSEESGTTLSTATESVSPEDYDEEQIDLDVDKYSLKNMRLLSLRD